MVLPAQALRVRAASLLPVASRKLSPARASVRDHRFEQNFIEHVGYSYVEVLKGPFGVTTRGYTGRWSVKSEKFVFILSSFSFDFIFIVEKAAVMRSGDSKMSSVDLLVRVER